MPSHLPRTRTRSGPASKFGALPVSDVAELTMPVEMEMPVAMPLVLMNIGRCIPGAEYGQCGRPD